VKGNVGRQVKDIIYSQPTLIVYGQPGLKGKLLLEAQKYKL